MNETPQPPVDPKADTASLGASGTPTPTAPVGVDSLSPEAVQRLIPDRYRIDRIAGSGGMGRVFAATDTVLERRVAIKLVRPDATGLAPDHELRSPEQISVLAEARAMAGLRHANLCRVHEVSLQAPVPFIVMDWIDGVDLRTAWRGDDIEKRLALLIKVVDAAAAVHSAGLVHRDLKPANILVDRTGEPIIVDFGLARSSRDQNGTGHTAGGTPGYAAPEQFEPGQPTGPPADVYSLGAIMYEMLADRLPFAASSAKELQRLVREEDPALPETYAPEVPWPLQRICLAALERDPSRRYPDAHALAQDLRRYLRGETVAARPSMLTEQFTEQVERQLVQVESWRRQGLATAREADRLDRSLRSLLRPESHWILESRRLSLSQVTLYMGGWFVLMGLTIGMYLTWDTLEAIPAVRYLTAWAVGAVLLSAGARMQRGGESHVALGYLITGCLVVPVAVWLMLRDTGWLAGALTEASRPGMGEREWQVLLLGRDPAEQWQGLMNRQVLVVMVAWLAAAVTLRRYGSSSAFTLWAVLAAALGAVAAWCSAGLLRPAEFGGPTRESLTWLGVWIFSVGAAALYSGLWLNRREERYAQQYGLARVHMHDAWSLLAASLLMIGIGLTLMAWNAADAYTLTLLGEHDDRAVRAVAFMVNGCVLQGLSHILERSTTLLRSRLAEAIRWVSPSHFLASILVLEIDADATGAWMFWLIMLVVASIACCYVSVWKQWRPFLFTGLFYIAVAYCLAFARVYDELDGEALDTARHLLMAGIVALGIATMVLAWRLPVWIASLKLDRWLRARQHGPGG